MSYYGLRWVLMSSDNRDSRDAETQRKMIPDFVVVSFVPLVSVVSKLPFAPLGENYPLAGSACALPFSPFGRKLPLIFHAQATERDERGERVKKKKPRYSIEYQGFRLVGMTRFELATTRPPDVYSNRAELHPELVLRRKDSNNFLFIAN